MLDATMVSMLTTTMFVVVAGDRRKVLTNDDKRHQSAAMGRMLGRIRSRRPGNILMLNDCIITMSPRAFEHY